MKGKHVMFLNLDGPLFSKRALLLSENNEFSKEHLEYLKLDPLVAYWCADPVSINMLVELYRLNAYKLVITGGWSKLHSKEQITNLLRYNRLGIELHDSWTVDDSIDCLTTQINNWLTNNYHEDYIIVNGELNGIPLKNHKLLKDNNINPERIVITSSDDGILMKDYYKMQSILMLWNNNFIE